MPIVKKLIFCSLSITALLLSSCNKSKNNTDDDSKKQLSYTYSDLLRNYYYQFDSTPLTGSPKLLVIPVWFSDSDDFLTNSEKGTVRNDIITAYNGTDEEAGWKSVRTYYETLSQNQLSLDVVVSDWYEINTSYTYYKNDDYGTKTTGLVKNAVKWYKDESGDHTLTSFDSDNNGYLDGVILIYAAPSNGNNNLWAYCDWIQENKGGVNSPVANVYFWASYDFMYGEDSEIGDYYAGDTSHCHVDAHTYIHEMGHMLGLEDYYDYSGKYNPASGFSMQDFNVGCHDPYSVMALGWAKPYTPNGSCTIEIKPFQSSHDLILLSPSFDSNSPFDEYLLLELYTPDGLNEFDARYSYMGNYPKGPTQPGLRVWHVDARLVYSNTKQGNLASNFATTITKGKYYLHAMSNTYYSANVKDYISPLGKAYANYNILQLIRKSTMETYTPKSDLTDYFMFHKGDTFKMDTYKKQFVTSGKLNSGLNLNWSFKVEKLDSNGATIKLVKH